MYRLIYVLLPLFLATCSQEAGVVNDSLNDKLTALKATYAPDKRTDRVEIALDGQALVGYTTRQEVLGALEELLKEQPDLQNSVRLLPDTAVGDMTVGIINVAAANLRSNPGHSQELATQALLGTPVQLLDKRDGWYLVRTPDRYIAWLEPGAFIAMPPADAEKWFDDNIRLYVGTGGELREQPGKGRIVSSLVTGSILRYLPTQISEDYRRVGLPDGKTGWVLTEDIIWAPQWWEPVSYTSASVLETAAELAGRPYLWGGTSPNGMDCSGFTKMSYYLNGFVIPRDASQQVHAGTEVALTDDFSNLQPGDQLFFGRYREDGSEKVTHTGFYLGEGRFLHAGADNGRIMENSLIPGAEDYAAHRLKSLLRARRLSGGTDGVVPVGTAFGALIN